MKHVLIEYGGVAFSSHLVSFRTLRQKKGFRGVDRKCRPPPGHYLDGRYCCSVAYSVDFQTVAHALVSEKLFVFEQLVNE